MGGAEGLSGEFEACALYSPLLIWSWNLVRFTTKWYRAGDSLWTIYSFDFGGIAVRTKRKRDGPQNQWPLERQWGQRQFPAMLKSWDAAFLTEKLVVKIKTID